MAAAIVQSPMFLYTSRGVEDLPRPVEVEVEAVASRVSQVQALLAGTQADSSREQKVI